MTNITTIPQHKFSRGDIAFRDHKPYAKIFGIVEARTIGGNTLYGYIYQYIWEDKEEAVYDDGWVAGAAMNIDQIATFDQVSQSLAEEEEYASDLADKACEAAYDLAKQTAMLDGVSNA